MIRNYFKTALRNIARNKLFTFLNILGLSLGLATTILILFWVQDELSYDKYHNNANDIYRVIGHFQLNGVTDNVATVSAPMAATLMQDYPDIVDACRMRQIGSRMITIDEQKFRAEEATYADSSFFTIFNIPILKGDQKNLLNHPNYIMLSETSAKRFYGKEDPIGKTLKIGTRSYMVSGIYTDIPKNTHFNFEIILSMPSLEESFEQIWLSNNFHTYIRLHPETDINELETQMQEMVVTKLGSDIEKYIGKTLDEFMGDGSAAYKLQKLTDIHLKSDLQAELEVNSDISNVYIFSFIAIFILVIACINFMNMSTARSEGRSREVGIRKVAGAVRGQIIFQYLLESFVITVLSYFLAMILVEIYLPSFNDLSGKNIDINYFDPQSLLILLGIIVSTSLISGSYPSFFLSSFQPIETLKGTFKSGKSSGRLRNVLVVIQFFTTIILISSSIFVYNQLTFIQNKKLGYEKEQLICLHNISTLGAKANTLKQELLNHPEILNGSISSYLPVPSSSNNSVAFPDGDQDNIASMYMWVVDEDYVKTFQMKIVEGRDFSTEFGADSLSVLVNEACLRQFGWETGEGHFIRKYIDNDGTTADFKVVGVIEDFHFESLKSSISPMIMELNSRGFYLSLRFNASNAEDIIKLLEDKWKEFSPNYPFEYSFVSERFNDIYFQEQRMVKIMRTFTILAIIIASLGLFGLAAFIAEKRTKEIGIRKVNGASLINIFMLFTKDIAILILIAFVLAVPLTWYIMDQWLNNFTYRVDINFMVFLGAGLLSFMIAILTISYQAYMASTRNPIESLKYE
jgi:putative ABC transport system permease protein